MKTRINKMMVMMVFTMMMAILGLSGCIVTTPTVTNTVPDAYAIPGCNIRIVNNYLRYDNVYPGDRNYVVVKATNVGSYRYYGELIVYAIHGGNMIELGYRSVSLRAGETKNLKVYFDTEYFCMGDYIIVPSFNTDRGEVMYYDPHNWYNNMIMTVSHPRVPFGEPYFCHNYYAPIPGYVVVPPRPSTRPAHYSPVPPTPHYYDTPIYGNNYPSPAGSAAVSRRQSNTAGSMSSRASGGNNSGSSSAVVNRPSGSSSSSSSRDRDKGSSTVSPRNEGSNTAGSSSSSSSRDRDKGSSTVSPRNEGSNTTGSSSSSSSRDRDNGSSTVSPRNEGSNTTGSSSSSSSRDRDNGSSTVSPRNEGSSTTGSSSSSSSRDRDNDSSKVSSSSNGDSTTSSSSSSSSRQRSGKSNTRSTTNDGASGTTRSRSR